MNFLKVRCFVDFWGAVGIIAEFSSFSVIDPTKLQIRGGDFVILGRDRTDAKALIKRSLGFSLHDVVLEGRDREIRKDSLAFFVANKCTRAIELCSALGSHVIRLLIFSFPNISIKCLLQRSSFACSYRLIGKF